MIINLVGPPAAGKSTFAARFVLEHPEFTYCSIDEYRIKYQDEGDAWFHLQRDIESKQLILLETCGLSWRLRHIFYEVELKNRPVYTVAFLGDSEVIHQRLSSRQRREVPYPYHWTEHETIDYILEHIDESVAPINHEVWVSNINASEAYEDVCTKIAQFRVKLACPESIEKENYEQ